MNRSALTDEEPETVILEEGPQSQECQPVIYSNQEEFLRAICIDFQKMVQPVQSGLMDELRKAGVIDSDDEERVKARQSTADRAMALWTILLRVPERIFGEKCFPVLKDMYEYVLGGREFVRDSQSEGRWCMRHVIMGRVRINEFADLVFPVVKTWSHEDYRKIKESRETGEDLWTPVFRLLKENSGNKGLRQKVWQVLRDIGVDRRANLSKQFRNGFPCMCRASLLPRSTSSHLYVDNESTEYPSSDSSSGSGSDSDSAPSSDGQEDGKGPFTVHYQRALNRINQALVDASKIRSHFRELEMVRDRLRSRTEEAEDSCSTGQPADTDDEDGGSLYNNARDIRPKMCASLEEVQRALEETSEVEAWTQSGIPPCNLKYLLERRKLLHEEETEAKQYTHFDDTGIFPAVL